MAIALCYLHTTKKQLQDNQQKAKPGPVMHRGRPHLPHASMIFNGTANASWALVQSLGCLVAGKGYECSRQKWLGTWQPTETRPQTKSKCPPPRIGPKRERFPQLKCLHINSFSPW